MFGIDYGAWYCNSAGNCCIAIYKKDHHEMVQKPTSKCYY